VDSIIDGCLPNNHQIHHAIWLHALQRKSFVHKSRHWQLVVSGFQSKVIHSGIANDSFLLRGDIECHGSLVTRLSLCVILQERGKNTYKLNSYDSWVGDNCSTHQIRRASGSGKVDFRVDHGETRETVESLMMIVSNGAHMEKVTYQRMSSTSCT
jgi:hypothetical protein